MLTSISYSINFSRQASKSINIPAAIDFQTLSFFTFDLDRLVTLAGETLQLFMVPTMPPADIYC
jgi:hypothetical protein